MNDIYNRKDEEFTVIGEVPESLKLNDPLYKEGFQAGAASRDAEFARLRAINSKLCEKSNWYVIHTARLEEERDQLRAQINVLRAALTAKHIEICKKLAAENEGLAGEVWCERCADAIEKGGVL